MLQTASTILSVILVKAPPVCPTLVSWNKYMKKITNISEQKLNFKLEYYRVKIGKYKRLWLFAKCFCVIIWDPLINNEFHFVFLWELVLISISFCAAFAKFTKTSKTSQKPSAKGPNLITDTAFWLLFEVQKKYQRFFLIL